METLQQTEPLRSESSLVNSPPSASGNQQGPLDLEHLSDRLSLTLEPIQALGSHYFAVSLCSFCSY